MSDLLAFLLSVLSGIIINAIYDFMKSRFLGKNRNLKNENKPSIGDNTGIPDRDSILPEDNKAKDIEL